MNLQDIGLKFPFLHKEIEKCHQILGQYNSDLQI